MPKLFLRTWKQFDLDHVKEHLLMMGDTSGDCGKCRALGIDPWKATTCPECGTAFKYLASRRMLSCPGRGYSFVRRGRERRSALELIDCEYYQKSIGVKKATNFFST